MPSFYQGLSSYINHHYCFGGGCDHCLFFSQHTHTHTHTHAQREREGGARRAAEIISTGSTLHPHPTTVALASSTCVLTGCTEHLVQLVSNDQYILLAASRSHASCTIITNLPAIIVTSARHPYQRQTVMVPSES